MLFIFFFVLTMSSGYVLTSVTKEKENRIVEVFSQVWILDSSCWERSLG